MPPVVAFEYNCALGGLSKGICFLHRNVWLMDRAATCREAARDAVADVEPPRLHDVIADTLEGSSMLPSVLTLASAAALDPDADLDGLSHRAAGVQLIYEGLRLTRTLAHTEPWTAAEGNCDGDLEILAADILVARGFYLLARTEAATRAVATVQAFGRDQTNRRQAATDRERVALDASLERDVLELSVVAGAAAVGAPTASALLTAANELADDVGTEFPTAKQCLTELGFGFEFEFEPLIEEADSHPGEVNPTDRATSVTDP